jgi:hypothetical protein
MNLPFANEEKLDYGFIYKDGNNYLNLLIVDKNIICILMS